MNTAIDELARCLASFGITRAFGVTGSGPSLRLITQLESHGVPFTPVAHEASAALMAGAVFRAGGFGAAIAVKGPGFANLLPGIVHNALEHLAALTVTEAYGPQAESWRRHKRVDQHAVVSPIAKATATLGNLSCLDDLLRYATSEVPGPVHFDLHSQPGDRWLDHPPGTGRNDLPSLLDRIATAHRPVVVVGALGLRRAWRSRLAALRVPVFTTAAAKGALNEAGAHAAGVITGDGRELAPESRILPEADLMVGVGLRSSELLSLFRGGPSLVAIDEAAVDMNGDLLAGYEPALRVIDQTEGSFDAVFDVLSNASWGETIVAASHEDLRSQLLASSWNPARCFEVLNELSRDHVLVLDTGSFCTIGEHLWRSGASRPFIGSSCARFMGASIPTALGYSLTRPGLPIVCVAGDGGTPPYVAEIRTAVAERLPICVVLMTDGGYGSIASVPQTFAPSQTAITTASPSWWRTVEGMGVPATRVSDSVSFERAVNGWSADGPVFIEAVFDAASYRQMTAKLR